MKLTYSEKYLTFDFECTYYDKEIPKNVGFKWNPHRKVWWTDNPNVASDLLQYASAEVFEKIDELKERNKTSIEESQAVESSTDIPKPEGLEYMPFQIAGIDYALKRNDVLIADEMGLGKAQSLDSKILTPFGWKLMRDIKKGDKVIGNSGKSTEVLDIFPQGLRDMYNISFSDGSSTECSIDHLWEITTTNRKFRKANNLILSLKDILKSGLQIKNGNNKYYIPMVECVEFKENKKLPIDPYVLGCILGDGGITQSAINFTCEELYMISKIRSRLPNTIKLTKNGKIDYRFVGNNKYYKNKNLYIDELYKLNLMKKHSYNKFIPDIYKINSVEVRLDILRGLLDTDGYVSKNNTVQYYTSSKQLSKDVTFIAQSLGATVRKNTKIGKIKNKEYRKCYILTLAFPYNILPVTSQKHSVRYKIRSKYQPTRAIVSVESIGKKQAQCIRVANKNGLYVTDDFIVTHNTIQAIGVVNGNDLIRKVLVVCPATMKLVWKAELEKWLVNSNLKISVWDTKNQEDGDIIIINYDILARFDVLKRIPFSLLIGDEIHYCKSNKAQRSKAFYKIAKKAIKRLYLTGTPILNRPAELFYILKSLNFPMNWGNFMNRYANAFIDERGHWNIKGASNLDELQEKLRGHLMIRRLKKDVLKELPDKSRQIIELPDEGFKQAITKEEKYIKEKQKTIKEMKVKIKQAEGKEEYNKAVKELREFNFTSFADLSRIRHLTALKKVPKSIEHIKEVLENEDKIVVFAHHRDVLDSIYKEFQDKAVLLTGDTPVEERKEIVDHFQTDPNCKLFIASIKAGGIGITLTASSTVIFVELDWTPAIISQAEDRLHRIGQENAVLVQHLVINGSIDSKIAKMCVRKQEVITQALDKPITLSEIEEF